VMTAIPVLKDRAKFMRPLRGQKTRTRGLELGTSREAATDSSPRGSRPQ